MTYDHKVYDDALKEDVATYLIIYKGDPSMR